MLLVMMPMPPDTMPRCVPNVNGRTSRFFCRATEAELVQGGGELAPSAQREPDLGGLVGEPPELLAPVNLTMPIKNQSIETPD